MRVLTAIDGIEASLERQARHYLVHACGLSQAQADAMAAEAARAVVVARPARDRADAGAAVIQVARGLAADATAPDVDGTLMPTADGRSMRVQPLDPVTLAELGTRSRRGGRRLARALPGRVSVAWGAAALLTTLLALPRPPL
ncbi:hypothetical protein [Roseospira goensis]|uniref:Uncharacterized protein n=1 Tax=Roseospira goensis TaxID=391922 RepID=A0A7W6RXE2_9PROT|nr:hypothetical protein [Roseospira goensis]MBB4284978.1 hypothetical protein [Roseospira goensis]